MIDLLFGLLSSPTTNGMPHIVTIMRVDHRLIDKLINLNY